MPRKKKSSIIAQQPKPGPISIQDVQWVPKTRKGFGKMITVMAAYLPFNRVEDFIVGQTGPDGSDVEWIVADRARGVQVGRPQIDSYIEHVHYECAFGPKDHTGDPQHPHSKKRGCIAKFSIKQLLLFPDVVEVAYYHVDHTREDGSPAHGLEDKIRRRKSAHQPRMSKELKDCVKKTQQSQGSNFGDNIVDKVIMEDKKEDMEHATNTSGDVDNIPAQPFGQTQASIEGCLLAIEKLLEDAKEEARRGGLLLVQQLQAMMTKTLTDVKRLRDQIEADNSHPQSISEVVDDDLGDFIVREKDVCEQAMFVMSSQRKRNRSALDG